jgi:formylglycine-generating enzyme required for sulfatase activity
MMGDERERHKVNLGKFYVARYPVTNAQWVRFVAATGHKPLKHWPGGVCPLDKATHPVVYLTWYDLERGSAEGRKARKKAPRLPRFHISAPRGENRAALGRLEEKD